MPEATPESAASTEGGATEETTTATVTETTETTDLGDAGKRAIEAERKAAKDAEKRAKAAEKKLAEIEAANQTEAEKAIAAARDEGRNEALSVANQRIVKAELKTAAAGILADPDDAAVHIDATQFEVDDDGNVDTKAIAAEIASLAKAKPYLTAGAKPAPLPGGGATPSAGTDPNEWFRQRAQAAR